MNCDADVEADSAAGSFAGILYDYYNDAKGGNSSEHAEIHQVILGGNVTAKEQAGAFVGRLTYSEPKRDSTGKIVDKGRAYLSSDSYNQILLTSNVTAEANASVWGYFYLDPSEFSDQDTNVPSHSLDIEGIRTEGKAARSAVWGGILKNGEPLWGTADSGTSEWTSGGAYTGIDEG